MIYAEHNFLEPELFEAMRKKTEYLYKLSKHENHVMMTDHPIDHKRGVYENTRSVQECMRFRFWCNGDDVYKESIEFLGPEVAQVLDKMYAYFATIGCPNIKLSNVWFQYGDENTKMYRHSDGEIHGASFDDCFTSMIFTHESWPAERGGDFRIEELNHDNDTCHTYQADPNLLLLWNRNHPHWMEPIKSAPTLRMFFGMSWYQNAVRIGDKPGDSVKHQNIVIDKNDTMLKDMKNYNDGTQKQVEWLEARGVKND